MNNRDRMYVEFHCTSCKRNHMISREAAVDRFTVKKCPHCLSPKVAPTGMLGFTATNQEVKNAIERGLGIMKDMDDEQVQDVAHEMKVTTTEHQKEQIAGNIEGIDMAKNDSGDDGHGTARVGKGKANSRHHK